MSEQGHQEPGDIIEHQSEVEEVVGDMIADSSTQAHIADVPAAAGATPTKAEWDAMATKFNQVLDVLEAIGALPAS